MRGRERVRESDKAGERKAIKKNWRWKFSACVSRFQFSPSNYLLGITSSLTKETKVNKLLEKGSSRKQFLYIKSDETKI